MAGPYHGKIGNLVFGTALVNLQSWTLNTIADVAESTSMGDDWQDFNAGLTDFNATAEGLSQTALDTVALIGTSQAAVDFTLSEGGPAFVGGGILISLTETVNIDGNATISYTIEGNDAAGLVYNATGGSTPGGNSNAFHGKQLHASAGTSITNPTEWSITLTAEIADATAAHASNTGRVKLVGVKGGTCTITAKADLGTEVVLGATVVIVLGRTATADAADGQYGGSAICTGYEFSVDRNGVEVVTYSFTFITPVTLVTTLA